MKSQTYMEKLYGLISGKENPGQVFGVQTAEAVTPQLGPAMPPKDFPSPLRYPPTMGTLEKTVAPPPQRKAFDVSSIMPNLMAAQPIQNPQPLPSDPPPTLPTRPAQPELAAKTKVGSAKVEDLSKKAVPSEAIRTEPSLIDATIQTANRIENESLPAAEALREDIGKIVEGAEKPLAKAEARTSAQEGDTADSRDLLRQFAETNVWAAEREPTPARKALEEVLFASQERMKEFDPNSVERQQLSRLTEAILAFGGPLLGALTGGTAGQMAGAAAGQAGLKTLGEAQAASERDYQARLKAASSNANEMIKSMNREQIERMKTLMKLEDLDSDEFKAKLNYETQILRTRMDLAKAAFGVDSREYVEAQKLLMNFMNAFAKIGAQGAGQAANLESRGIEGAENRRVKQEEGAANRAARAAEKEADRNLKRELEAAERASKERLTKARGGAKAAGKPLRESQARALGFYYDAKPANDAYWNFVQSNNFRPPSVRSSFINVVEKALRDASKSSGTANRNFLTSSAVIGLLPNTLTPNERREISYRLGFIIPVLRDETGAAINADEWINYNAKFFALPGASKNEQIEKHNMRLNKLTALKAKIGEQAEEILQKSPPAPLSLGVKLTPAERRVDKSGDEKQQRLNDIRKRLGL